MGKALSGELSCTWTSHVKALMVNISTYFLLGVCGFVVNDKNQLLVIQEKYHPGSTKPRWKLPGGHADKGNFNPIALK